MNTIFEQPSTVGEIVAQDYRTAEVFKEFGIDFCCGGKKDLSTVCTEKGVDPVLTSSFSGSYPKECQHTYA